jgi:hypothetical protein
MHYKQQVRVQQQDKQTAQAASITSIRAPQHTCTTVSNTARGRLLSASARASAASNLPAASSQLMRSSVSRWRPMTMSCKESSSSSVHVCALMECSSVCAQLTQSRKTKGQANAAYFSLWLKSRQ